MLGPFYEYVEDKISPAHRPSGKQGGELVKGTNLGNSLGNGSLVDKSLEDKSLDESDGDEEDELLGNPSFEFF